MNCNRQSLFARLGVALSLVFATWALVPGATTAPTEHVSLASAFPIAQAPFAGTAR